MTAAKKLSIRLEAVGGDKVRQEFKRLGTDEQQAFHRITQVIQPANDNLKVLDNTAKAFNNTLKQAAGLAGAYLGFKGLVNTFKSIVSVNQEFERLSGSLKTVTGSVQAAKEAFTLIEDFATSTPYQLDEIVDSFIRFKAMGLEPSMEALTSYGNTASAFGKNILDFVGAVTSATVGEFERLKTFGIKAKAETDTVKFIFQGVTTEVAKNASAIEEYLRSIGDVNFAGAMNEQMDTIGGKMSNLEDTMAKIARTVGTSGLDEAIKDIVGRFDDFMSGTEGAAKTIGETLATAVNAAAKAFSLLGEYIDEVVTLLTVRLGAVTVTKTFALLRASVFALNTALIGTGTAGASAVLGLQMMWQVSKVAAVQMYATAAATKVLTGALALLRGALALIGGPAGLAVLAGVAIYKLVDSHNVAKRAAQDHAETLQKLKDELAETVKETTGLMNTMSKNQAIAEWGHKLKVAEQNVKDLQKELKNTGGISFFKRHAPNFMLDEYEIFANDLAEILSESKYNLDEYEKKIWELAAEYPDFKPQANAIQEKLLLLKAAQKDAWTARQELKYLEHPELRPKEELQKQTQQLPAVDTSAYEKNIEDIKQKVFELQDPYSQAMQKAREWRDNALKNLDSTKSGYEDFKNDVNRIYDDMVKKANEVALKSSTDWKDGITRGMQTTYAEASDMAKATESIVKNSFGAMEDTLTEFVMTGKAGFADLVNSIVEGMVRMAIQYAVIKPLMDGIMGYFGVTDYLGSCLQAKNETTAVLDNALVIKSEIEQLKSDTQEFRDTAESYKNMSQTTFNSVSSAVAKGISDIQTEGTTQVSKVKTAVSEQVAKATAQADRAENATSSKLDITLANISKSPISKIMQWLCPDWKRRTTLSLNTDVTITKTGWILMRNTVYNSNITGYINGYTVFRQYGNYGHWEEYNSLSFLVSSGDIVKLTDGELTFMPCKGA